MVGSRHSPLQILQTKINFITILSRLMTEKKVFVQQISHRAKEATVSSFHTEEQLSMILKISPPSTGSSVATQSKTPLSVSWAPNAQKGNRYGGIYKCSRVADLTHSKFLCPEGRENRCPEYSNKLGNLDEFLADKKMNRSFVLDEQEQPLESHGIQNLLSEFSLFPAKSQKLSKSFNGPSQLSRSLCPSSPNSHSFNLNKGFHGDSKGKGSMSVSQIMKHNETRQLYRSIVYTSQSYDLSKEGFLIDSSSGKSILERVMNYLKGRGKSIDQPFFSLKTNIQVEGELFETNMFFKVKENNIAYNWQCSKHYPNVSYFHRHFEFFNHFRIDLFQHELQLLNTFTIEPFLRNKACRTEAFTFQLRTTLPFDDMSQTETRKCEGAGLKNFEEEHAGFMSWDERHA